MSKLKTVWDAVNNLECGTLKPDWCRYIGYNRYHGFYFLQNDSKFSVCTIAEFNALVVAMSLGLDVNPVNHGHYLNYVNAGKAPLEKEALDSITNKPLVYTQEMADSGVLPSVGMRFLCGKEMEGDLRTKDFKDKEVEVIGVSKHKNRDIITFHHNTLGIGCGIFFSSWVKPIDQRTKKEKAVDEYIQSQHHGLESLSQSIKTIMKNAFEAGTEWKGE
tara:strand:- start:9 stop:662 length:654 start_codon:yes stop_codon:yes gene_type:complete